MNTTADEFKKYCEKYLGFVPNETQLKVFEMMKDKQPHEIIVQPRQSTGKSYLAFAVKSYLSKYQQREQIVQRLASNFEEFAIADPVSFIDESGDLFKGAAESFLDTIEAIQNGDEAA